jgi:stress response protein SCP2
MINLNKDLVAGGRINLSKDDNGNALTRIFFGANWGMINKGGGFLGFGSSKEKVDLDSSAVCLDENKRPIETISYYHLRANNNSIFHSGDDRGGDEFDDGCDNETITVDLPNVDSRVHHIVFILNNYTQQKFEKLPYMGLRIYTTANGKISRRISDEGTILAQVKLDPKSDKYIGKKGIILGEVYRHNGEWKFKTIDVTGTWGSIGEITRELPSII